MIRHSHICHLSFVILLRLLYVHIRISILDSTRIHKNRSFIVFKNLIDCFWCKHEYLPTHFNHRNLPYFAFVTFYVVMLWVCLKFKILHNIILNFHAEFCLSDLFFDFRVDEFPCFATEWMFGAELRPVALVLLWSCARISPRFVDVFAAHGASLPLSKRILFAHTVGLARTHSQTTHRFLLSFT